MTWPNDTADPQDEARIERWLTERAIIAPRPDGDAVLRASLQQILTTRQRQHRWSIRWFQPADDAMGNADDRTPQETRRSRTMFSSTRIAAAVVVAVLGTTALLWTALPDSVDQSLPGAPLPDASTASTFTGTRLDDAKERIPATIERVDGVTHNRGDVQNGITVESTGMPSP